MKNIFFAVVIVIALALAAHGQQSPGVNAGEVHTQGKMTSGNCVSIVNTNTLSDAGAPCGTGSGGGGNVSSVFTRTGAVVAAAGDYTPAQVLGTGTASQVWGMNAAGTSQGWQTLTGSGIGGTVTGSLVPNSPGAYTLGSATNPFGTTYVAPATMSGTTALLSDCTANVANTGLALEVRYLPSAPADALAIDCVSGLSTFGGGTTIAGNVTANGTTNTFLNPVGIGSGTPLTNAKAACAGVTGGSCFSEASTAAVATAGVDTFRADSTAHAFKTSLNGGSEYPVPQTICSGTITLPVATINSGLKSSPVTAQTCTGLLTTDNIKLDFASDPSAVTGYQPSTTGMLTIIAFPTANTINVYQYNNTAGNITPGAMTLNYHVWR